MEEENNLNSWLFTPLALGGSSNHPCYMTEAYQNHYFNLSNIRNETPYVHAALPQCICSQQTQDSVKFLTQSGSCESQMGLPSGEMAESSSFRSIDLSGNKIGDCHQIIGHLSCNEEAPLSGLTGSEFQAPYQNLTAGCSSVATVFPSKIVTPRVKASDADRRRRLRISDALDALEGLVPNSRKGGKESVVDEAIDHIKYLQFQIKELSQRRLRVESSWPPESPFIFVEGYGHYLISDQVQNEPLEEMMGKLMEINPSAAAQLLESRGLYIWPMAFAEGLHLHPQT